jgi:hypothetical protein
VPIAGTLRGSRLTTKVIDTGAPIDNGNGITTSWREGTPNVNAIGRND